MSMIPTMDDWAERRNKTTQIYHGIEQSNHNKQLSMIAKFYLQKVSVINKLDFDAISSYPVIFQSRYIRDSNEYKIPRALAKITMTPPEGVSTNESLQGFFLG